MINNEKMLQEILFHTLPLGLIVIDKNKTIQAWNHWLEENTQISAEQAAGKSLEALCAIPMSFRFSWALEQVLQYGHPQVLSAMLNEYILPISMHKSPFANAEKMQQDVQILPINYQGKNMALVVITDVSDKIHLKNTLMAIAAKFEQSSYIDILTGCFNRRFLYKYLETELLSAKNRGYTIVCCLYDIDYFKEINDTLGHDAGDEVLIYFTKLVKSVLRPCDYFFRYGGEEFISISSHIRMKDAAIIPNRIRILLENKESHGSINKRITCSGGVSYWTPSDLPISAEQLVSLADVQLYKAKTGGRNRIMMDDRVV